MPAIESDNFYPYLVGLDFARVMPFKGIVIHHSATPDNPLGHSWKAIRKFHMDPPPNGNGWTDIGYHCGVELVPGAGAITYLLGRELYQWGSHAKNWNGGRHGYIGLCVVGNFGAYREGEKSHETGLIVAANSPETGIFPPQIVWDTAAYMVMALRKVFKDKRGVDLEVLGHRETYVRDGVPVEKSCPGWKWDMDAFRAALG